jgi:hypothetical protein
MAIIIPDVFASHIQGSNTSIFPYVVVDVDGLNIRISTNTFSIRYSDADNTIETYKPLLLNVPSLKESIDLETRKYKINSVTLDISNVEYEGVRFSDLVSSKSLINSRVQIFWGSPVLNSNNDALLAYNGTVRRYTHTDEKVKIELEDRSQAYLHKDLPLPENYLGTGEDIPDKYKNKPIPMVYGYVDKSPLLRYHNQGNWYLQGDVKSNRIGESYSDSVFSTVMVTLLNALFIYRDGSYLNVVKEDQFEGIENEDNYLIKLGGLETVEIEGGSIDSFYIDNLNCTINHSPAQIKLTKGEDRTNLLEEISDTSIFYDNDINTGHQFTFTTHGDTINAPEAFLMIIPLQPSIDFLEHYKFEFLLNNSIMNKNSQILVDNNTGLGNEWFYTSNNAIGLSEFSFGQDSFQNPLDGSTFSTGFCFNSSSYDSLNLAGSYPLVNRIIVLPSSDQEQLLVQFKTVLGGGVYVPADITQDISINIQRMLIKSYIKIENVFDDHFYGGVRGRLSTGYEVSPTAPAAISDILVNELGVNTDNIATLPTEYSNMQYAFTVHKKTNSKKLIEGLASASPYIPHFNNQGSFKFDTIPSSNPSSAYIIQKSKVIDFTYKRTKIENVKTKIELKYKIDYARDEFSKSVTKQEDNSDLFNYYGLESDHSLSTLVVDDNRGKYIRDDLTADKFCEWLLDYHKNQHLIMTVKLPLSSGLPIEVGDIVEFDKLLGDVKPYGIDYTDNFFLNNQKLFPNFIVTSTNKTLDMVTIECEQLHELLSFYGFEFINLYSKSSGVFGTNTPTNFVYANYTDDDNGWQDRLKDEIPPIKHIGKYQYTYIIGTTYVFTLINTEYYNYEDGSGDLGGIHFSEPEDLTTDLVVYGIILEDNSEVTTNYFTGNMNALGEPL